MNRALFVAILRINARTIAGYLISVIFYLWLLIWVYPSFAGSQSFNALLQKMPRGLMKALGYSVGTTHLGGFLAGEFYSLLYLVIMGMYAITTATKLIARPIDNGSMAYLLVTPFCAVERRGHAAVLCGIRVLLPVFLSWPR